MLQRMLRKDWRNQRGVRDTSGELSPQNELTGLQRAHRSGSLHWSNVGPLRCYGRVAWCSFRNPNNGSGRLCLTLFLLLGCLGQPHVMYVPGLWWLVSQIITSVWLMCLGGLLFSKGAWRRGEVTERDNGGGEGEKTACNVWEKNKKKEVDVEQISNHGCDAGRNGVDLVKLSISGSDGKWAEDVLLGGQVSLGYQYQCVDGQPA